MHFFPFFFFSNFLLCNVLYSYCIVQYIGTDILVLMYVHVRDGWKRGIKGRRISK